MTDVSIVIPTHDRVGYLQQAVASALTQTGVEAEVVVVDDASTDGTAAWLAQRSDPQLVVLRNDRNLERGASRNRGIEASTGRFILFLDDDDLLPPGALERLVHPLASDASLDLVIGGELRFDDERQRQRAPHPRRRCRIDLFSNVYAGWTPGLGCVLFRREHVERVGGWDETLRVAEDQDLYLRLDAGPVALVIPEVTLHVRRHAGQWRPADHLIVEEQLREEVSAPAELREFRAGVLAAREQWEQLGARQTLRIQRRMLRLDLSLWLSPVLRPWTVGMALRALPSALLGARIGRLLRAFRAEVRRLRRREVRGARTVDRASRRSSDEAGMGEPKDDAARPGEPWEGTG